MKYISYIHYESAKNNKWGLPFIDAQNIEGISKEWDNLLDYIKSIVDSAEDLKFIDKNTYYQIPTDLRINDTNKMCNIVNFLLNTAQSNNYFILILQKQNEINEIL